MTKKRLFLIVAAVVFLAAPVVGYFWLDRSQARNAMFNARLSVNNLADSVRQGVADRESLKEDYDLAKIKVDAAAGYPMWNRGVELDELRAKLESSHSAIGP